MSKIELSRFWDIGEENIVTPSQNSLYKIMNALILCKGKLHASHSLEVKDFAWTYPTKSCAVCFRISLPIGNEAKFEEISGFKLSQPDIAKV